MGLAEANAGHARFAIVKVVVVIGSADHRVGDLLVSGADQADFVMVVEHTPRDRDERGLVLDLQQAIVVVLTVGPVRGQVAVIDPHVLGAAGDHDRVVGLSAALGNDMGDG